MIRIQNRTWITALLALGLGSTLCFAKSKTLARPAYTILQNKDCGFSLRYPKDAQLEALEGCTLKITFAPIKGAEWIEDAHMMLEVSAAENGEATEKPVDEEEVTGTLVAGGLKYEKSLTEDSGAGHTHIIVSYTAIGKKRQYHWVGLMTSTDPNTIGSPIKNWDPKRSAQKLFDGFVQGLRPLE